ncbi:MAG: Fic family protein [Candidatus Adiutrix sp.]|jgi:Fic family protein|nr:Fic family protein [Candidatus Adiutrix sp.]
MFTSWTPGLGGPLQELAGDYSRLEGLKAKLDKLRPLSPAAAANLRADMVLRYTYNSNALEGNTLTLNETKAVLEQGVTIGGKSLREHLEAINHREAIDFLESLARDNAPLSERTVKDLHAIVLKSIDRDNAGRWRRQNVLIGGSDFRPPEALHVPEHLAAFFNWGAAGAQKVPALERAARVHADFVSIHPFLDGNGRTARLLMNLELMKSGYPVAILPVSARGEYYDALTAIQTRGDYLPFVRQICSLVEKSFEPYRFVLGV